MKLTLAIDPAQLAAPLPAGHGGKASPEGEALASGFASLLAETDPEGPEAPAGDSVDVGNGNPLPAPGNPLPVPSAPAPALPPVAVDEPPETQEPADPAEGDSPSAVPPKPVVTPQVLPPLVALAAPPLAAEVEAPVPGTPAQPPVPVPAAPLKPDVDTATEPRTPPLPVQEVAEALTADKAPTAKPVAAPAELPSVPAAQPLAQTQPALQPPSPAPQPMAVTTGGQSAPQVQLETLIDSLVQARESGRAARGEIVLRHAEFGAIAVKLHQSEGDMLARISSRDPGFASAAQAALADRQTQAVAAASDSQSAHNRPQDGSTPQGQPRDAGFAAQHDRSGSGREQRSPHVPQPQPARTQRPSAEQHSASPRDGSLLA